MQDLVDTLRKQEDTFQGMTQPILLNASGKESLGGIKSVGITTQLQDAQVAFEPQIDLIETGTATSTTSSIFTGITLFDTAATFVTNGVKRGDTLVQVGTPTRHANVLDVVSETELFSTHLDNSEAAGWTASDVYEVFENDVGKFTDGNLTALSGEAAFPTFGLFAQVELSTSASIVGVDSVSGYMRAIGSDDASGELAAQNLRDGALTMRVGTVNDAVFSPTITQFEADGFDVLVANDADHFRDAGLIFSSGSLSGQPRGVTATAVQNGRILFTVEALTDFPANGDTFVVVG